MEAPARKIVLDTDVLINFLRGSRSGVNFIKRLKAEGAELLTTSINIFELAWGLTRSAGSRSRLSLT